MYKMTVRRPGGEIEEVVKDEWLPTKVMQAKMIEATRKAERGEIIKFERVDLPSDPAHEDWLKLSKVAGDLRRDAERKQAQGLGAHWTKVHEADAAADAAYARTDAGKQDAADRQRRIETGFIGRGLD